jgi:hypothetical protein
MIDSQLTRAQSPRPIRGRGKPGFDRRCCHGRRVVDGKAVNPLAFDHQRHCYARPTASVGKLGHDVNFPISAGQGALVRD